MFRDIREEDESMLRNVLGIKSDQPLPGEVIDRYWFYKKLADRITWALTPADILNIVWQCDHKMIESVTENERREVSAYHQFRTNGIQHGHPCSYSWRGKDRDGMVIGTDATPNLVIVQDKLSGDERRVEDHLIRLLPASAAA